MNVDSKFYSKQKNAIPSEQAITTKTDPPLFSPRGTFFYKCIFGGFVIVVMVGLQLTAWYWGHNGIVFAFTSAIVGLITGSIFGFEWGLKRGSD